MSNTLPEIDKLKLHGSLNELEWSSFIVKSQMSWHLAKKLEVKGWMLPSRKQLNGIFNILADENEILNHGFVLDRYWTSEHYEYNRLYIWSFNFKTGDTNINIKQDKLYVRLCKPRNVRMC